MSDFFERQQPQNNSNLPQGIIDINEKIDKQINFQERMRIGPGTNLSLREYASFNDLVEKGLADDDEIYKMISSKNLSEYLSEREGVNLPTTVIYENYDEIWRSISEDRENRYATPRSRWEAIQNSIQIAKNIEPMGAMGLELQTLHNQLQYATGEQRQALQKKADELWEKIMGLRTDNEELGGRFPKDALTTIATATIQSAPLNIRSSAAGLLGGLTAGAIGALATGGAGAAAGFKIGYSLASFAASSSQMAGLMYIDLLAAGVEQKNAAGLAILGGGINGIIESGLGVVAGVGSSAVKAVGGRVISQEASRRIAEAASKSFITNITQSIAGSTVGRSAITKTIFDTVKNTAGEGLEEGLQYLVEHAMLALGDAMQDDPVNRNLWGSPEFKAGMEQSVIGGFAGGLGFNIISLPLNITGNVRETARQTEALKNLAITIDDKAEFKAAAKELPITKHFNDGHFDEVFDSQEGERQRYNQEIREEAQRTGRHQWASMPTLEAPGEMRRQQNGRLSVRVNSPEGDGTGTAVLYDPPTRQRMGSIEFDWDIDNNTVTIENIELSQAITDREKVIGDMIKELSYNNPEMSIEWNPNENASASAGVDLAELKNKLIAENPRGEDWSLQFYQKGDRFNQSRAMNDAIDLIASTANVSRDIASDTYEAWNIAFRNFGLDTHEMISKMGLTSERNLRIAAANDPQSVEARVTKLLDQGKIAAQKVGKMPTAGTVVIKQNKDGSPARILYGREALNETIDQLRAITVLTEKANPSTLHHEWLHFMVNVVIPNSQRYRTLLEDAVGKKLENFDEQDHEWLADNYERYLRTGEAPTSGLKALFKRIAEALRQFVKSIDVSPKLREFFDQMLAGPDSGILKDENHQAHESGTKNRARVQTDNDQQKAFAEMTSSERILQSDLHSAEEKAEILFSMKKNKEAGIEDNPIGYLKANAKNIKDPAVRDSVIAELDRLAEIYPLETNKYLAHNGKPSNLNHAQWYAVRTKNFKEWFGDWELEPISEWLLTAESVKDLQGDEFQKSDVDLKTQVLEFFNSIGGKVEKKGLGTILLNEDGIQSDIAHKLGREKCIAFAAIPEVIKDGKIINYQKNWKGRGYDTYVISAPLKIGTDEYIAEVIINQNLDKKNEYYLHEVALKEKARNAFKTATKRGALQAPYLILPKLLAEVKGKVSKVVDENNEPMPVFHGSNNQFEIFKTSNEWGYGGAYFSTNRKTADIFSQGNSIYDTFINLRNPLIIDAENRFYDSIPRPKEIQGSGNVDTQEIVKYARENNYDGVIINNVQEYGGIGTDVIAFEPNQIKSATDNIGTFDPQNPSILFQTTASTDTEEFKKWFGDSKVVSGDGQPKIVYHNTSKRFTSFDLSKARQSVEIPGFFFTDTQGEYADFGDIEMQVYLSIKNPFIGNYGKYKGIKGGSSDTAFINIRNELIKDGYDGIITEEEGQPSEYIAFFPKQIKSIYNRGTWNSKVKNILFQMTRDEIYAEAMSYTSWEAWMKGDVFGEAASFGYNEAAYRRDNAKEEPQSKKELEAWYEKQWNEAQVLAREAALGDDGIRIPANAEFINPELLDNEDGNLDWLPEQYEDEINQTENVPKNTKNNDEPITTSEANKRLKNKLPGVIDDFILIMGNTLRENLAHFGAATEEDAAVREQIEYDKNRIYKEVHPYIRGLALGMTTGKKLSDKQRRTAISHMSRSLESGAIVYRELYTSMTEDEEFVNYSNNEIQDEGVLGEAQKAAAEAKGLTAFQRTRLAENIIDKDIAQKIRAGAASSVEIANYIKRRNEEINELDNEIKNIKEELKKSQGETEEERNEVEAWRKQYYKTRKELQAAKKESEQLQIKLEKVKQVQKNAAQRAKDGREKSEIKLKEQLKAKREEINKLKKSIKEKIVYAKKHGKLEKAWQWAEQRQKLAKKEAEKKQKAADRKAAQKYLEANKKLTTWIMSADRVGMKVWVRQRELILGLQNALFETSKTAAYARQKDREIKEVQRDIEKLNKRLKREKDESEKNEISKQIDEKEAFLANLKSERNNIEIMGPYLKGMEIGENWEGVDTMDTGTIIYNGATLSVEEFRKLFYERKIRYGFMDSKLRRALQKSAPKAFKGKYSEKIQNGEIEIPVSLGEKRKWSAVNLASEMSQEDLLTIKAVMQQLNKEGRANWERREFATKYQQQQLIKKLLFNVDELEEEGETLQIKRYIKAMNEKNIEERKRLLSKGGEIEQKLFETFDNKRLLQWMDGNRKGALYKLIIRERLRYANRRDVAIDQRTKRIMEIIGKGDAEQQEAEKNLPERLRNKKIQERAIKRIKQLGDKNIKIKDVGPSRAIRKWEYDGNFNLQEAQSIFENSTEIDVSLADLMFLVVALDNKFARAHYLFGNLWSDDERAYYEKFLNENGTMPANVLREIEAIGRKKEKALRNAIDEYLFEDDGNGSRKAKNDLMQIVDAIRDDFESHFAETRAVYQDMFNQSVEGQDNYLPIIITEGKHAQAEKQSEIEALTQGSYQVKISPDKGMNLARVDIGPTHQTEIESDIFKVYFKGVEREEHFNKFAPYVRDINTVLRGRNTGSKQLAQKLTDVYGKWAVDRLYQHVNMIGLPPSAKLGNAWESAAGIGKILAGNAGVAYIAYNIPAWLAQYPNSIAAFFGKADARFILSSCLELMKPGNDLVERVFEKSPKVKQRVISVAEEYREYLAKQPGKFKEAHSKLIEIGMLGQRHADQTMVAAGWWALYQTALKEGKSEEDAVIFADEITSETQPDLNALETSPTYKDQGLGGLMLRFTQPLNVIWQNLTYDSFISREKSFSVIVPRFIAYGLAALTVAAMRGALTDKDDDENDREELMKKIFYYMVFSNIIESVPLVGSIFSGKVERWVTGEGVVYQDRNFELMERLLNIPEQLIKEDFEGAINDAIRTLGLGVGLPVSQMFRIKRAIQEKSPWIIFGYEPK